ncbi:MAG TPA: hypothetical protein VG103_11690 [Chthoniobacterales bacterium]|nr:hypothetical protein [Chthoniobacterales bacterium]
MTRYERKQVGWVVICGLCIALSVVAINVRTESSPHWEISVAVELLLLLSLAAFYKLTIKIDDHVLRISFGVGAIRKEVQLTAIDTYEPVRIRWWYGWGIHLTPYGWLYNVSGWDAVAIKLRNGKKFAIGTEESQALVEAIRRFASVR